METSFFGFLAQFREQARFPYACFAAHYQCARAIRSLKRNRIQQVANQLHLAFTPNEGKRRGEELDAGEWISKGCLHPYALSLSGLFQNTQRRSFCHTRGNIMID